MFIASGSLAHSMVVSFSKKKPSESQLPPDQRAVPAILRWGVDHAGIVSDLPVIERSRWRLTVDGDVENQLDLDFEAFLSLPKVESVSDFHCVEGWSVLDQRWEGVRLRDLLKAAKPRPSARFTWFECADGYATSLPLGELLGDEVLLADRLNGEDLPQPLGGPVRLVVPHKYAFKSPMWLTRITLMAEDRLGFWEKGYYSNTADPWRNERYRLLQSGLDTAH